MAELEGAALEKALAGNKFGVGIGAGGEIEGIEGGELLPARSPRSTSLHR